MDQNIAKFSFDFQKKNISKSVTSFLEKHFQNEELKTSVSQMAQGKKLKKDNANLLLQCLFAAIVQEGQEEEDDSDAIFQDSQEVISPNADSQSSQSQNSPASGNQSQMGQTGDSQNSQAPANQICKFYKKGKCRYGKECRNEHPKFCKKFIKHGSLKFSPQGCDSKCCKPHPDAC
jgi:hypothetical protein